MKTMIEAFTSVFFITVASVLLASMISSYILINNARNYHLNVVDRLENSDFQQEYMELLIDEAKEKGYKLQIKNVTVDVRRPCYLVTLEYKNSVNAFYLLKKIFQYEGVIEGYAT